MKRLIAKSVAAFSRSIPPLLKNTLLKVRWIDYCRNLIYQKIGLQVLEIPNLPWPLYLYLDMSNPGERLFVTYRHESYVVEWLLCSVESGWVVLDIGAFIGFYTIILSRLCSPQGRVIAFEPIKQLKERILKSAHINNLNNIVVESLAVGAKSGVVDFYLHENPGGGFGTSSSAHRPVWKRSIQVEMVTIDEYVDNNLIKIDTEGGEVDVLRSAQDTLRRFRPVIIVEFNNDDDLIIGKSILISLNYSAKELGRTSYGVHILGLPKE